MPAPSVASLRKTLEELALNLWWVWQPDVRALFRDYLKSASDLGLPMVGVGLFYALGYFRQRLDPSGWQTEMYGTTDVGTLPLRPAAGADGAPLVIEVPCGNDRVRAGVWIAHVGRARLLLLDTNVADNTPAIRELTARLYGGDEVTRIRQEIVLGIGGLRALRAIGVRPIVLHLNEGHSAFAILERMRERVQEDALDPEEALRQTAIQTVFTTHTPVEAGHDRFAPDLVESQLGWLRQALGYDRGRFMTLGRVDPDAASEPFCMTVLAIKGSRLRNAVSDLHGHTARRIWRALWPHREEEEVPIGHITNGVHTSSWLATPLRLLFDRYLGPNWLQRQSESETWHRVTQIGEGELWEVHCALRRRLIEVVARRTGVRLNPSALTIGFARRFATYKRATLAFSDPDRFARIVADSDRPIQFVVAGKAHPKDDGGKAVLQHIVKLSREPRFNGRLVVVEDYDMGVGRLLVQGVDVWLNTPLRPLEACGTSGQKAALNGVLNAAVLDGWWAEAYDGLNGFAIGSSRTHRDPDEQWKRDAESFYRVLEDEIQPLFYDVDSHGIPVEWVTRMKRAIETLAWRYNADRMVIDYAMGCYLTAAGGRASSLPR